MNIVAIAIDTLSARHMSCYGYPRETTPFIDALAERSVLFESCYCPVIPTQPSFTTFYTGQYPITHGILSHGGTRTLSENAPWFVRMLRNAGYTTCAVDVLNRWKEWFARGYEFYIDPRPEGGVWATGQMIDWTTFNHRAIPWLRSHADEKFFLFVHYWDPHTPYLPPEEYRELFYKGDPTDPKHHTLDALKRNPFGKAWQDWFDKLQPGITDAEYIVAMYDAAIRYVDDGVKQLLGTLDELGIADDTMVVLFSDHGEMMYRHGIYFDHHGLYDPDIHVPLLIHLPGANTGGTRIPHLVQHIDLAPTILDAAGIEIPPEIEVAWLSKIGTVPTPERAMEGTSLVPYITGQRQDPIYPFLVTAECTRMKKWALRTAEHKLILSREQDYLGTPLRELYDLKRDPDELNNVYSERGDVAERMERTLENWIAEMSAKNGWTGDPLRTTDLSLGTDWVNWVKEHGYW
jgi:arylsulfatase A-like enzyme